MVAPLAYLFPRTAGLAARSTTMLTQAPLGRLIPTSTRLFSPSDRIVATRLFSTSRPLEARRKPQAPPEITEKERPFRRYDDTVAPYPHGPARFFKQQNRGLYGGLTRKMVTQVSKGRNKGKTKRVWKPNVQYKRLWSQVFGRWIRIRVATTVLQQIDAEGGLDNYLLADSPERIRQLGERGWLLRMRLLQTDVVQELFRVQRQMLGVPADGLVGVGNTVQLSPTRPGTLEEKPVDADAVEAGQVLRARLEQLSVRDRRPGAGPPAGSDSPSSPKPSRPKLMLNKKTFDRKTKLYRQFGLCRKAVTARISAGKL